MKNNTINKPLWLRRMNKIAILTALILAVIGLTSAMKFFGGFSGIPSMDIFIAALLPVLGLCSLIIFPPAYLGVFYIMATIVINIDYTHKEQRRRFNNRYNNYQAYRCNYGYNRKFCGFGNDRYYM